MASHRSGLFQAFENIVSFYPKMSAAIAFATMASVARMIPTTRRNASIAINKVDEASRPVLAKLKPTARKTKRNTARKPPRRTVVRRKAA